MIMERRKNFALDSRVRPFLEIFGTAANVDRLNEKVATDTLISNTPALDDGIMGHGGATMAQIYVGCSSQITEGYPMSSESQMHSTLMDFIRDHGAPNILFSDNAKAQIGAKVTEICRHYNIGQQQSEPHYQHQNPAERRIQDIKRATNSIIDCTNILAYLWLLCTM